MQKSYFDYRVIDQWALFIHSIHPAQLYVWADFFWEAWHIKKVKVWKHSKDKSRRVNTIHWLYFISITYLRCVFTLSLFWCVEPLKKSMHCRPRQRQTRRRVLYIFELLHFDFWEHRSKGSFSSHEIESIFHTTITSRLW